MNCHESLLHINCELFFMFEMNLKYLISDVIVLYATVYP